MMGNFIMINIETNNVEVGKYTCQKAHPSIFIIIISSL
jgi:hypothetical protein